MNAHTRLRIGDQSRDFRGEIGSEKRGRTCNKCGISFLPAPRSKSYKCQPCKNASRLKREAETQIVSVIGGEGLSPVIIRLARFDWIERADATMARIDARLRALAAGSADRPAKPPAGVSVPHRSPAGGTK